MRRWRRIKKKKQKKTRDEFFQKYNLKNLKLMFMFNDSFPELDQYALQSSVDIDPLRLHTPPYHSFTRRPIYGFGVW